MATSTIEKIEDSLNDIFVKSAPELPKGGKDFIVKIAPIASLVIGVLTLLSALSLWHWARVARDYADYAQNLCNVYTAHSCNSVMPSRFTVWVWISLIFILIEGVLYLAAYSGLRDRKKQGWNYIYYGALLNVAYAVVSLFTDYDKIGHFLGALIGSSIGFYLLFQVRTYYTGKVMADTSAHHASPVDHSHTAHTDTDHASHERTDNEK